MGAGGTAEGQRREGECEEGKVSEATFAGFTPRVVMCACVRVLRGHPRETGTFLYRAQYGPQNQNVSYFRCNITEFKNGSQLGF